MYGNLEKGSNLRLENKEPSVEVVQEVVFKNSPNGNYITQYQGRCINPSVSLRKFSQ